MLTKIETQSRKKAKLTRYFDVTDFQILLLVSLIVPFLAWFLIGLGPLWSMWPAILFVTWLINFKIDKPSGYWSHFLNHRLRGKLWTGYNGYNTAKKEYLDIKVAAKDSRD
jgi:sterol desaturase/sphingolipid hydroxylase (fatty acid hydroxylase superfamily)